MTDIGGVWYMEKSDKGLLPLNISKLNKKHKITRMKLFLLYEANTWWNDCRFQLHWNNLEWFNPRSLTKRNKPFAVSSKMF